MQVKKNKKKYLFLLLFLLMASFVIPLPYFIEMPGSAEDISEHVRVNQKKDEQPGSFMLTTVYVKQGTIATLASSYFNPNREIVSKKEMMGGSNSKEYNQMQKYYMESSQNLASKVALDLTDKPYKMAYKGVYVMSVMENSDFSGKLSVGSTITGINGKKMKTSAEFIEYVQSQKVGDSVTLTVDEESGEKEVTGKLIQLEETKKTGIGISLVDHTELVSDEKIEFMTDDIGGPSAGLMFTLQLYSMLSGEDIRNGLEIAGTGTIDSEGVVGRIGRIDKKVIAAENAGAEIFFAPDDEITDDMKKADPKIKTNYQEAVESAKRNKLKLKIVPVKTVQDAINYLEKRK